MFHNFLLSFFLLGVVLILILGAFIFQRHYLDSLFALRPGEEQYVRLPVDSRTRRFSVTESGIQPSSTLDMSDNQNVVKPDILPASVLHYVPFTPQAPFGDWGDPRQQDGCEEASILMGMYGIRGESLSRENALRYITELSAWQEDVWGYFEDTSAYDTSRLIREYFSYTPVRVEYDVTIDVIRRELASGNLVIVPTLGKKLFNPFFTPPGPERHMVVVRGYDDATREFIVNDPGTRHGEAWRYSYNVLYNAIQDYPSGHDEPLKEIQKAMIVLDKE